MTERLGIGGECECLSFRVGGFIGALIHRRVDELKNDVLEFKRLRAQSTTRRDEAHAHMRLIHLKGELEEVEHILEYFRSIPFCEDKKKTFALEKVTTLDLTPELAKDVPTASLLLMRDTAAEARKMGLPTKERELEIINRELERRLGNP